MRLSYIKKLIKLVEESDIGTLEITRWGTSVRVEKASSNSKGKGNSSDSYVKNGLTLSVPLLREESGEKSPAPAVEEKPAARPEKEYLSVKAPMVGTFYRAPSPDAPPYVEVGNTISKGQVLCIIEAMKLMNEIQSEVEGTIRRILVQNAEPIEYGQELFLIEP